MSTEVKESATYAKGGRNSYFHDLGRVSLGIEDPGALARLRSHAEEMESGSDGYHVLPAWMQESLADIPPRGYLGLVAAARFPHGTNVINIPNAATGSVASAPVLDIAGRQKVAFRLVHHGSPIAFDETLFRDMRLSYHAKMANRLINEKGGVRKTPGIASVTAPAIGDNLHRATIVYQLVGDAVQRVPTASAIAMHPRRWAALRAAFDGQGVINEVSRGERPDWAVGEMHGVPAVTDSMIPTHLGDNEDEDAIQVLRIEDLRHFASDAYPRVTVSEDGDPIFWIFGYHAFTAELHPENIVDISGPALSKPDFG